MNQWNQPSKIDRLYEIRGDESALDRLAASSCSRLCELGDDGGIPISDGKLAAVPVTGARRPEDLLLGRVGTTVWWARRVSHQGQDLRYASLDAADTQLAMMATALFEWHDTNPSCLSCGQATVIQAAGLSRRCLSCGAEDFPRTDPAVIVAVTDSQDRLLLTHNSAWVQGRVSIQAGFVEAGESAEQACYREIAEETGLQIDSLEFAYSQPWPFPRSLMLGFRARVEAGQPQVDGNELTWGRFFSRHEFQRAVAAREILLPGPISLARQLIEEWVNRG